jgi:hypothetical protein
MDWEREAKEWERIAETRMGEINRLRSVVRRSTNDDFIVDQATTVYVASKYEFDASRAAKADPDAPLDDNEIRCEAKMKTVVDFIRCLGVMDPAEFINRTEAMK